MAAKQYGVEASQSHKVLRLRDLPACGVFLRHAYDCTHRWERFVVNKATPEKKQLFNFNVPLGTRDALLVLDDYGDDVLPLGMKRKVTQSRSGETLGIRHKTGEIVQVGFIEAPACTEDGEPPATEVALTFRSLVRPLLLPSMYRSRLAELLGKTRPFHITVRDSTLCDFITRWASYHDLGDNLVVDLHFDGQRLQVCSGAHRTVSDWTLDPGV